ncbi:hypothetical protein TNCV_1469211 [Trichonephila clavipes]|nr:hypothetical protein TNCV_1469211 [Trichonephila clavipes]
MPDEEMINNGKTRKGEERVQRNPCHWRSCQENVCVKVFLTTVEESLTYYEIPADLVCAYLNGHLTDRAREWFEEYYRFELEAEFYASKQSRGQLLSEFLFRVLKLQEWLNLEMAVQCRFKLISGSRRRRSTGSLCTVGSKFITRKLG